MKRTQKSILAGILIIIFELIIYPALVWEGTKTIEEAIEKSGWDIAKIISRSEGYVTKVIGYSKSGDIINSKDSGENPIVTKVESR